MGEIFKRERASESLRFSGERLTDEATGQIEIEHLHRYFVARHYCRGKDVLDIASGEGYGSAYLAQVARSVIGVEIDPNAVAHAAKSYCYPNLRFQTGDARHIDLPDASVDVVVSFETLEHFYEHEDFIREIRRVLRGDGLLIISTPEQDVYSPTFSPANPFHVRELTKTQFVGLLQRNFPWVELCFQRPLIGSLIIPETHSAKPTGSLFSEKRGPEHFESHDGMARPLYLVAFASAAPQALASSYVYIENSAIASEIVKINERLKAELQAIYESKSWRILGPVRFLMRILRRLTRLILKHPHTQSAVESRSQKPFTGPKKLEGSQRPQASVNQSI